MQTRSRIIQHYARIGHCCGIATTGTMIGSQTIVNGASMNIIEEILKANGGQVVGQLAQQFGLNQADAGKALSNLIPAIAGGIKKTAQSKTGLESLITKVNQNQDFGDAINRPDVLGKTESTQQGNEILGDIFGSKDVSRTVANQTAQSTGIDLGVLKKMLPLVAGLVMSSLNKRGQAASPSGSGSGGGLGELLGGLASQSAGQQAQPSKGGIGALLGRLLGGGRARQQTQKAQSSGLESLLDFDGDGSVADDVLNLAKKLF